VEQCVDCNARSAGVFLGVYGSRIKLVAETAAEKAILELYEEYIEEARAAQRESA
jgi:hypothetical protein